MSKMQLEWGTEASSHAVSRRKRHKYDVSGENLALELKHSNSKGSFIAPDPSQINSASRVESDRTFWSF